METTDYCSYELSKALKAAGFDEPCDHYWYKAYTDSDKMEMRQASADDYNNDDWNVPHCSAPHIYHAQKWLREKHALHIVIEAVFGGRWTYYLNDIKPHQDLDGEWSDRIPEREGYPSLESYEQALSAGIAAALELIEIK